MPTLSQRFTLRDYFSQNRVNDVRRTLRKKKKRKEVYQVTKI